MNTRNNGNTEITSPSNFISLFDVSPHNYVGDAGKVYIVNPSETGLIPVATGSFIPPVVGTGTLNDIPVFNSSSVPIFLDSGVNIDGSQNLTNIRSITTQSNIYLGPVIGGGDTGNILDLNLQDPENQTLFYDSTSHTVILGANVNGGDPADLVLINGQLGSTGSNNIYVVNYNANGIIELTGPTIDTIATSTILLNETTDGHLLQMDSTGVQLICGNSLPLSIVTLGNPGSVGDVLTNLSGGAGWAPASGGGSLPTYMTQVTNPVMFGSSSDATSCFISSSGTAPTFYANGSLPWPGDPSTITFNPTPPYNVGTVPFSLVPGNYALNLGFLGNPSTGIAQFTITNATSGGSPTVLLFDTWTSNTNNIQMNFIGPFTVSGTGYQNILVNILCDSTNPSSSAYALLPCTDLTISPVYTV